jgi:hypothetical protein
VRAETCWHGRQDIRAVIVLLVSGETLAPFAAEGVEEAIEMRFSPLEEPAFGERVTSMSCHQSSSTALSIPESWNHYARGSA